MDELEISGKRYISAKRAGKENKYHPDYIGQLIRAGKVAGQKVGRAWYIEADSLAAYLNQESAAPKEIIAEVSIDREETADSEPALESELIAAIEEVAVKEKEAPEPVRVTIRTRTEEYEESKLSPPITNVFPVMPRKNSGLRYITDEGPLFPVTAARSNKIAETMYTQAPEQAPREQPIKIIAKPRIARINPLRRAGAVVLIGGVVFVLAAVIGKSLVAVVNVKDGQTASVGYGLDVHSISF